jgi:hypothetical protein
MEIDVARLLRLALVALLFSTPSPADDPDLGKTQTPFDTLIPDDATELALAIPETSRRYANPCLDLPREWTCDVLEIPRSRADPVAYQKILVLARSRTHPTFRTVLGTSPQDVGMPVPAAPKEWSLETLHVEARLEGSDVVFDCRHLPRSEPTSSPLRTFWMDEQGLLIHESKETSIRRSSLSPRAQALRCMTIEETPLRIGLSMPIGIHRVYWQQPNSKPLWILWDGRPAQVQVPLLSLLPANQGNKSIHCHLEGPSGPVDLGRNLCPRGLLKSQDALTHAFVTMDLTESEVSRLWHESESPDTADRHAPRSLRLLVLSSAEAHRSGPRYGAVPLALMRRNKAPKISVDSSVAALPRNEKRAPPAWCFARLEDPENDHLVTVITRNAPGAPRLPLQNLGPERVSSWQNDRARRTLEKHKPLLIVHPAQLDEDCELLASDGVLLARTAAAAIPHARMKKSWPLSDALEDETTPNARSQTPFVRKSKAPAEKGAWHDVRHEGDQPPRLKIQGFTATRNMLRLCISASGRPCPGRPILAGGVLRWTGLKQPLSGQFFLLSAQRQTNVLSVDVVNAEDLYALPQWSIQNTDTVGPNLSWVAQRKPVRVFCFGPESVGSACRSARLMIESEESLSQPVEFLEDLKLKSPAVLLVWQTEEQTDSRGAPFGYLLMRAQLNPAKEQTRP